MLSRPMRLSWIQLFIDGLACYRLALMLSEDDGPWGMFRVFRAFLKKEAKTNTTLRNSEVAKGIECIRCDSIWIATPIAVFAYYRDGMATGAAAAIDIFLLLLALSGIAILWNRTK